MTLTADGFLQMRDMLYAIDLPDGEPMKAFDLEVTVDPNCYDISRRQVRFPRSKKRRIREKWRKREVNWKTTIVPRAVRVGKRLFVHPLIWEQLQRLERKR